VQLIDATDPILVLKPTAISAAIKLPILTRRTRPTYKSNVPENEYGPLENPAAYAMNLDLHILSDNWGGTDKDVWGKNSIGNVIVVREDRKAITPHHVEVFAEYCLHVHGKSQLP
jgi:hypothetical protein